MRDDEDNHECVMIAIAILEIPRLSQELKIVKEVCVRVYGCPVCCRVSVHLFGKLLRWVKTRKIIGKMMSNCALAEFETT